MKCGWNLIQFLEHFPAMAQLVPDPGYPGTPNSSTKAAGDVLGMEFSSCENH